MLKSNHPSIGLKGVRPGVAICYTGANLNPALIHKEKFMDCSICGKEESSTCDRPITLGGLGEAKTRPICDKCYGKMHDADNEETS